MTWKTQVCRNRCNWIRDVYAYIMRIFYIVNYYISGENKTCVDYVRVYVYIRDGIMHSVFRLICQWVPFPTLAGNQNSLCLSSRYCSSPIVLGSHTTLLFLFYPVCGWSWLWLGHLIYSIRYNIIWSVSFSPRPFSVYALVTSTRLQCVMVGYSVGSLAFVCPRI